MIIKTLIKKKRKHLVKRLKNWVWLVESCTILFEGTCVCGNMCLDSKSALLTLCTIFCYFLDIHEFLDVFLLCIFFLWLNAEHLAPSSFQWKSFPLHMHNNLDLIETWLLKTGTKTEVTRDNFSLLAALLKFIMACNSDAVTRWQQQQTFETRWTS